MGLVLLLVILTPQTSFVDILISFECSILSRESCFKKTLVSFSRPYPETYFEGRRAWASLSSNGVRVSYDNTALTKLPFDTKDSFYGPQRGHPTGDQCDADCHSMLTAEGVSARQTSPVPSADQRDSAKYWPTTYYYVGNRTPSSRVHSPDVYQAPFPPDLGFQRDKYLSLFLMGWRTRKFPDLSNSYDYVSCLLHHQTRPQNKIIYKTMGGRWFTINSILWQNKS